MKNRKSTLHILMALAALMIGLLACADATPTVAPVESDSPSSVQAEEPTARPTEDDSVSETAYDNAILDNIDSFVIQTSNFASLFGEVGDNPMVLLDDGWMADYDRVERNLRSTIRDARSLTPPASRQTFHNHYMDGMDDLETALDYFRVGVDDVDPDSIETGNTYLNQSTAHMENALSEVDSWN